MVLSRPLARDRALLAMMAAQTLVWAGLYYSFPALVLEWQAEFGWSSRRLMGAFTLAAAIYGLGAPLFGRIVDAGLSPLSFPAGALMGAGLLSLLPFVETPVAFYALWAGIGLCMGFCLYEPCFALVTRARGLEARRAITAITLAAGFASTISYPVTYWLSGAYGWRVAIWALAAVVAFAVVPLLAISARGFEREARDSPPPEEEDPAAPAARRLMQRPEFWWLSAGFALPALVTGIVTSHMLPLMDSRAVPAETAILAASLVGPAQVLGRLAMLRAGFRLRAAIMAQVAMATIALAAMVLAGAAALPALALVFAVSFGMGHGVVGILRSVVTRETLGQRNFGAVAGAVSLPALTLTALAPLLAALLVDVAGYGAVIAVCILAPLMGAALLLPLTKTRQG